MKLLPLIALLLALPAAQGQHLTPSSQQHELDRQRQQLDQQQQELQRLQAEQQRVRRDAADACIPIYPHVRVPERYPLPMQPQRPAAAPDRTYLDRYVQRVLADPALSHEAKMRIVRPLLGE